MYEQGRKIPEADLKEVLITFLKVLKYWVVEYKILLHCFHTVLLECMFLGMMRMSLLLC